MGSELKVRFWGTRGLISAPGPGQQKYGGNTPCIQLIYKNHIIIIDTGWGVSDLGETLMPRITQSKEALTVHIFYTHFHWDHIQGLPFFHPIYFPSSTLNIYSPAPADLTHRNLDQLFDGSYSPFAGIDSMPSKINMIPLRGLIRIDGLDIDYCVTDHGEAYRDGAQSQSFAYRFNDRDSHSRVVVVTDHEARIGESNAAVVRFAKHCDLLIHDAQYNDEEYAKHLGWGHSSVRLSLENALKIQAKRVLLTHHDPSRTDVEIDKMSAEFKGHEQLGKLNFEFAKEGEIYEVPT